MSDTKAYKIGKAYRMGLLVALMAQGLTLDEAKWITVHPGGKGPKANGKGNKKGSVVLIESTNGKILGGMGGKFTGKTMKQVKASSKKAKAAAAEKAKATKKVKTPKAKPSAVVPKVEAPKVEAPKVEAPKVETPKTEAVASSGDVLAKHLQGEDLKKTQAAFKSVYSKLDTNEKAAVDWVLNDISSNAQNASQKLKNAPDVIHRASAGIKSEMSKLKGMESATGIKCDAETKKQLVRDLYQEAFADRGEYRKYQQGSQIMENSTVPGQKVLSDASYTDTPTVARVFDPANPIGNEAVQAAQVQDPKLRSGRSPVAKDIAEYVGTYAIVEHMHHPAWTDENKRAHNDQVVRNIEKALDKNRISKPLTTFRAVNGNDRLYDDIKSGVYKDDKAFTSTSPKLQDAGSYSANHEEPVLLQMNVPKGYPAMNLNKEMSKSKKGDEILLQKGLQAKVKRKTYTVLYNRIVPLVELDVQPR